MPRNEIRVGQTYRNTAGTLFYVHDIEGGGVTYCKVGSVDRRRLSLARFASLVIAESPNQ